MAAVKVLDLEGAEQGSVDLDEQIFGIEPNVAVMHQVVTAQLAARRAGTQSTRTRAEVAGGGAKPWKQKGTGRARQGSIRSPQWRGGGVALGPKPRSYAQRTPKKMIRLALRSALSDRAADGKVIVVDGWGFDAPSTKQAVAALQALEVFGRVVVVVSPDDVTTAKSFRNLPEVHLLEPGELNAYDVLVADFIVFSRDTLPSGAPGEAPERPAAAPRSTKRSAAPSASTKRAAATSAAAEPAPAPEADDDADASSSDHEGDTDMASDLPSRPKNTGKAEKPVDPSERVKPAGEKLDPRFEAARIKADKEAELRAKQQAAAADSSDDAADEVADDDAADTEATQPAGGFSFNQTVERDEDES
jgi:large subunit ribosomal protein L4